MTRTMIQSMGDGALAILDDLVGAIVVESDWHISAQDHEGHLRVSGDEREQSLWTETSVIAALLSMCPLLVVSQ
jgi:hypothetical protein